MAPKGLKTNAIVCKISRRNSDGCRCVLKRVSEVHNVESLYSDRYSLWNEK